MKYFIPTSLTWWSSAVPILIGLIVATGDLHGMTDLTMALQAMTGDVPPAILINGGLVGIGLRAAV